MVTPLILRMFIYQIALMLVVVSIHPPLLRTLGFNPTCFWLIMFLNVTVGGKLPPFGYAIFAFQAVVDRLPIG